MEVKSSIQRLMWRDDFPDRQQADIPHTGKLNRHSRFHRYA